MVTSGLLWGGVGAAFALLNGAPLWLTLLIGAAVGIAFAVLSRIGFKRAERDWAERSQEGS